MTRYFFLTILFFFVFVNFVSASALDTTTQIVLSPHFDDAALSLGGMLAASQSNKVAVTVFSGNPQKKKVTYWDLISGFVSSDIAVSLRTKEDNKALHLLHAKAVDLGFVDGQYRKMKISDIDYQNIKSSIESSVDDELLRGKVEVYGPAYFGKKITHPDHLVVHNIFLDMVKELKYKNVDFYMYEDMPYTINYYKSTTTPLVYFLRKKDLGYLFEGKDILLSGVDLNLKRESIDTYVSQMKAFWKTGQPRSKSITDFAYNHCSAGVCERVYKVTVGK